MASKTLQRAKWMAEARMKTPTIMTVQEPPPMPDEHLFGEVLLRVYADGKIEAIDVLSQVIALARWDGKRVSGDDFLFSPRTNMDLWRKVTDAFRGLEALKQS